VLNFTSGVLTQSFTVPIIDNTVTNASRVVNLSLTSPTGPLGTQLGSVSTATLTITDDDVAGVAGASDTGFAATFNNVVHAVAMFTNSSMPNLVTKLIVGGEFSNVNGVAQNRLVRLNRDGTRDTNFAVGSGANGAVLAVLAAPDGKVYIGGQFSSYNTFSAPFVARIGTNGVRDASFDAAGTDNAVLAMALQPDGRLLVAGEFTSLANNNTRSFFGRLLDTGADDASFATGSGPNDVVRAVLLLPDGDIIIGGDFTSVNGVPSARLARLTAAGAVDAAFATQLSGGFSGPVFGLALQRTLTATNIVAVGQFSTAGGGAHANIALVGTNGAVVPPGTFSASADNYVNEVVAQPDGRLILGGGFTTINGQSRSRLARLNADGTLDMTINLGFGADADVETVLLQDYDDRILFGGRFTTFNGTAASRLVRVNGRVTDGAGVLALSATNYLVSENGPTVQINIIRSGGLTGPLTATNFTADVTATNGVHYTGISNVFTLASGESSTNFQVSIIDTAGTNANRVFETRLVAGGITSTSTVTLVDNDAIPNFSLASYSISEQGGSATISVNRLGGSANAYTVQFATANGTAQAGTHYTATNGTLAWGDGDTAVKTFSLPIINNLVTNGNLTVNLSLFNATNTTLGVSSELSGRTNATLTIIDDEFGPGIIGFSSAAFTFAEDAGTATITVIRTNGSSGPMSVNFATIAGGTAGAGTNYTTTNGTFTWASGDSSSRTFSVPLTDNVVTNPNLTVNLRLSAISGGAAAGITNAVLTIADNDSLVGFSTNAFTISETGTNATITIIRTGATNTTVQVTLATTDGTASSGSDFLGVTNIITFAPGQTTTNFLLNILDDGPVDFTDAGLGTNFVLVGGLTNSVVVADPITDRLQSVGHGLANGTVVQFASTGTLPTRLATNTSYFVINSRTDDFQVSLVAGGPAVEGNETVLLNLSAPVGAVVFDSLLAPTNATLTIVDNETELAFDVAAYTVAETNGTALINVVRTGVTNTAVTVNFATGSGTAIDGLDYFATNGLLTFASGVLTQSFSVVVGDNTVSNVSRTVSLLLSNAVGPFGTQLGAISGATLTITNEDPAAVAGTADPSFSATVNGTVYALGINTNTALPNLIGKLVLAGDFTAINGLGRFRIARLNRNGTLDSTFNAGSGANDSVRALAVQPDGKVIIGGFFTNVASTARNYIARLNVNGTLDTTFNPGAGPDGQVNAIALQPDGKIIIGGQFTSISGTNQSFIARLNSNGTLDDTFDTGAGASAAVRALALMPDGSVIVGGDFQFFNGSNSRGLARVSTTGALDILFGPNLGSGGVNGSVNAIAVQFGTNLVIGGTFSDVGGLTRQNLARLGTNGVPSLTFSNAVDNTVNTISVQPDGKLLVGGGFSTVGGVPRSRVARLMPDGALDSAINFGSGADNDITVSLVQFYDDQLVLGGAFSNFGGVPANRLVRVNGRDNDGSGSFEFSQASYTVVEGALATITVTRNGGLNGVASVDARTQDGTATLAAGDYLTNFVTLSFAAGVNQLSFTVTNLNDTEVEGNETVNLALTNPTGGAGLGARSNAVMTIADNDARLAFTLPTFTVSESGSNSTISLVRTGGTNGAVTVDFATGVGGTATAGSDFVATNGTITFADGVIAATFNVRVLGDTNVEGNETVLLTMSNPNGVGNASAVLGTINSATLTILDDDFSPGTLALSTNAYTVAENAGSLVVTLTRTGGTLGLVSVNYVTANGSALAGSDYTTTSGTLSWPDGDAAAKTFSVTILDDGVLEGNETFQVAIGGASGGAALGVTNATVTIIDDDGVVQFAAANFVVFENATNAVVTVNRTGGITNAAPVVVAISTVAGGSASAGADFVSTNGSLTFATGVTSQTFNVSVLDDQTAEPNETFNLSLGPITAGSAILGSQTNATITIVDNDISVQFSSANFSVAEAGPNATITVTRTGATNSSVAVTFETSDGSAVSGQDYQAQLGTLTFAVGENSKTFNITILDDSVVEPDETVNLRLTAPTGGAVLGANATATLTIQNDDTSVEFTAASFSVGENQTNALISLRRLGVTTTAFGVSFGTANGTGVAGTHYVATNGVLNFASGATSNAFQVRLIDDLVPLGDRTVNLSLSNPTGGAVLGPQSAAVLTINDNEVTLQFSAATFSVLEDQTNALISVTRSGSGGGVVGVNFAATVGTATAGTDFALTNGTLTFANAVTNLSFAVRLFDDILSESNETVSLALSGPSGGATLGTPAVATLRVVDNDRVGSLDSLFLTAVGANRNVLGAVVYTNAASTNFGKVIIVGDFQTVDTTNRVRVARLNPDGTLDTSFNPGSGVDNVVFAAAIQSDERILIGGGFATVGGVARPFLARLNNDGTLDAAFNAGGAGPNGSVRALVLQPDGKPVIGGAFTTYNSTARGRVARLNTDGTLDTSFAPATGANDVVHAIAFDSATNLLVGGVFTSFNGTTRNQLAQVTPTGALGAAFAPAFSVGAQVFAVLVQPDGNILVGGSFTNVGAFARTNLARVLPADGAIDPSFSTAAAANSTVRALAREASGAILVGGDFTVLSGASRSGFGRLNETGTVDATYDPGVGIVGSVFTLALQPDGKPVVGGDFTTFDGVARGNVARINGGPGVIQFVSASASIQERATNVTLRVSRSFGAGGLITVNFGTTNGTASAGVDYVATNGVLAFNPGVTNQDIVVSLLNDTLSESSETFTVGLSGVVGGTLGSVSNALVTILDDDSTLQFNLSATNHFENGGSLVLTVERTGVIDSAVSLPFRTTNGTALHGFDYTGVTNTLLFNTNVSTLTITVPILNDQREEAAETFAVLLGAPVGEASLGTNTTVAVTLLDNDSTISMATNAVTVNENDGNVLLTVNRTGFTNSTVSAGFTTINGSATAASDFVATNGSLSFGAGVVSVSFPVPILNDQTAEPTETFSLVLTNVTGEASLGSVTNTVVTVLDNDSVLQFPFTSLNVSESAGNLSVTVQRVGATNSVVSVGLFTTNSPTASATENVDYSSVLTNLVFDVGVASRSVTIFLTNDTIVENTESFRVQLVDAFGEVTLGSQTNLTVNIIDDDFRTIVAAGTVLTVESFTPTNNAVDALETVTMNFSLRNAGNVNASNITATLLTTGGVMNPSGPQVYTNLVAGGSAFAMPFTFTATQAQTITATLQLSDLGGIFGTAAFTIDLGVASSLTNRSLINLPATLFLPSSGPAGPYPSTITVSNVAGVLNKVTVRLNGLTHTYPADLDVLLVSPTGQKVLLMSDAGGSFSVNNINLTFDDNAAANAPDATALTTGSYKPTDYAPADSFPAPAPAGPYDNSLGVLRGFSPNGTWSLYIVDDTEQNYGNIVNGWTLNFSTVSPVVDLAAVMTNAPAAVTAPNTVTFTTVITNRGPNIANNVVYTNPLPAGLTFVSATVSAGTVSGAGGAVVANLGPLGIGSNHVVTVTVATSGSGTVTNTASVTSGEIELVPSDNAVSSTVSIAPAIPFSLLGVRQLGGNFAITVTNTVSGRTYVVEATTNLVNPVTNTVWTPVATNVATGTTVNVTDSATLGVGRRYYRAIER
jgi:uncharacterized delta-60 repeat protein